MEQFIEFFTNHWQLSLAFIILLVITLVNELLSSKNKAKSLTPQLAVNLINNEGAVVIDLREKEAFKKGHIIDSINANAEEFTQPKMEKYKDKQVILVCTRGIQATTVAAKIRTQGFKPMVLSGGITAWQQADLPLVKNKG